MLVLDTSALFSMDNLPSEECVCPPGVIEELRRHRDNRLQYWDGILRVSNCSDESMETVKNMAKATGDLGRLSPVDLSVLALALDLEGTILSDDYSIQNVSRRLGIPFKPIGTVGISKVERWNYQCVGCRKWYKERLDDCPICGSKMKGFRR